jgi:hypothetical protein
MRVQNLFVSFRELASKLSDRLALRILHIFLK